VDEPSESQNISKPSEESNQNASRGSAESQGPNETIGYHNYEVELIDGSTLPLIGFELNPQVVEQSEYSDSEYGSFSDSEQLLPTDFEVC
jgi:hypothetical protein